MRSGFVLLVPALWFSLASIYADDEVFPVAKAYIEDALKVMQEHYCTEKRSIGRASSGKPCPRPRGRKRS